MSRRMSCSMTVDAVRSRVKTVTRRHVGTWTGLRVGDRLTLIEKGMGLPKGARQVVLAEVEVVDVRVEPITCIDQDDVRREGFASAPPAWFVDMWCESHGYRSALPPADSLVSQLLYVPECRRIEWRYLDEVTAVEVARP